MQNTHRVCLKTGAVCLTEGVRRGEKHLIIHEANATAGAQLLLMSIHISPKTDIFDLDFARGSVPTPYGTVSVAWSLKGSEFNLSVEIPERAVGKTHVTLPNGACYTVDGTKKEYVCLI